MGKQPKGLKESSCFHVLFILIFHFISPFCQIFQKFQSIKFRLVASQQNELQPGQSIGGEGKTV